VKKIVFEEPGAGNPHAGFCEGPVRQRAGLLDPFCFYQIRTDPFFGACEAVKAIDANRRAKLKGPAFFVSSDILKRYRTAFLPSCRRLWNRKKFCPITTQYVAVQQSMTAPQAAIHKPGRAGYK